MTSRRYVLQNLAGLIAAAPLAAQGASASPKPEQCAEHRAPGRRLVNFNPLSGNPLRTRADAVAALRDLYLPMLPYYSLGAARVRLDSAGASFGSQSIELEGFARPLWGLAPLAKGGGADFVDWDLFRRGLANGCDPEHAEYWGDMHPGDQRQVELAAVGFALHLIPHILFEPQSARAKKNIVAYLQSGYNKEFGSNNWMWFRVMIGCGLRAVGEPINTALLDDYLSKLDSLYLGNGWYRDGVNRKVDHYVSFAMQFYGAIYSKIGPDPKRSAILRERAAAFTPEFLRWCDDEGGILAFGRSMTYRFAMGGFWSGLAFADLPTLPWGQIKGLVLRHLRWWSKLPIAHRDGILSVGFGYPNLHMAESYNSGCSPYWAFKIFGFLALPENHPFWTSKEEALPPAPAPRAQLQPGMIAFSTPGNAIVLVSGQEESAAWLRLAPEKYSKFAYSSRYGFCIETDTRQFNRCNFDNMLAFSLDGRHYAVREGNRRVRMAGDLLMAEWSPNEDLEVETWLMPAAPWHIRVHRIRARRAYQIVEGGFAIGRPDGPAGVEEKSAGAVSIDNGKDLSGVRDLGSSVARVARVLDSLANSSLLTPRASVPQLTGEIPAGETVLITAVLALPHSAVGAAWTQVLARPDLARLQALIDAKGEEVTVMKVPRSK